MYIKTYEVRGMGMDYALPLDLHIEKLERRVHAHWQVEYTIRSSKDSQHSRMSWGGNALLDCLLFQFPGIVVQEDNIQNMLTSRKLHHGTVKEGVTLIPHLVTIFENEVGRTPFGSWCGEMLMVLLADQQTLEVKVNQGRGVIELQLMDLSRSDLQHPKACFLGVHPIVPHLRYRPVELMAKI